MENPIGKKDVAPSNVVQFVDDLIQSLENEGIRYCIERNYASLTSESRIGDIDILVPADELVRAFQLTLLLARRSGWREYATYLWSHMGYLGLYCPSCHGRYALTIELFAGGVWKGLSFLSGDDVVSRRKRAGKVWAPDPTDEAILTSIHHLLYNGNVPDKYKASVRDAVRNSEKRFAHFLGKSTSSDLALRLAEAFSSGNWTEASELRSRLKLAIIGRAIFKEPTVTIVKLFHGFLAQFKRPSGLAIEIVSQNISDSVRLAQSLIDHADRWHIYLPPNRFSIVAQDGTLFDYFRAHITVWRGGVVISAGDNKRPIREKVLFVPHYRIRIQKDKVAVGDPSGELLRERSFRASDSDQISHLIWNDLLSVESSGI